jgi:hypothetical protein
LGNYSLRIALVAARATANKTTMEKSTNFGGCFDGPGSEPVQYYMHCLMEEIHGFP